MKMLLLFTLFAWKMGHQILSYSRESLTINLIYVECSKHTVFSGSRPIIILDMYMLFSILFREKKEREREKRIKEYPLNNFIWFHYVNSVLIFVSLMSEKEKKKVCMLCTYTRMYVRECGVWGRGTRNIYVLFVYL